MQCPCLHGHACSNYNIKLGGKAVWLCVCVEGIVT